MNEIVSKVSTYNIFNYLIPGGAFCILARERGLIDLSPDDIVAQLIVFYVTGMALSRTGSLIVDPLLKRARLVPRSNYTDYVRAAAADEKVAVLLESSNSYRTMTAAFLAGLTAHLVSLFVPIPWLRHNAFSCVLVAALGVLFAVSYVKQNRAVTRRVRANNRTDAANDTSAPLPTAF